MKPSYLVAPVHTIDFYIHRGSEALSARTVIIKAVSQTSNRCIPVTTNVKGKVNKDLAVALNTMNAMNRCYFFL
jgi:hypothetical protein